MRRPRGGWAPCWGIDLYVLTCLGVDVLTFRHAVSLDGSLKKIFQCIVLGSRWGVSLLTLTLTLTSFIKAEMYRTAQPMSERQHVPTSTPPMLDYDKHSEHRHPLPTLQCILSHHLAVLPRVLLWWRGCIEGRNFWHSGFSILGI